MTAELRVAQFVYSNVEAADSPTGRRGFQVYRWSKRLAGVQREIARRLEDYDWPAADAAAKPPKLTERWTFFLLKDSGDAVIARTVPLEEPDALNRAGRFHAHAVVVLPREFENVGCDPFVVFDNFSFCNGPKEALKGDGKHGPGELEDEITLKIGTPKDHDRDPGVGDVFPQLLRWLDGKEDKPVAVPLHPERVARFLRELFRRLPADLRLRATFDTLSSGQQLGALPYRFAGAFDAATLRDWVYRKVYRLEATGGAYTVPVDAPPNPALDELAAAWDRGAANGDERTASYRLLRELEDPACTTPTCTSKRVIGFVADVAAARESFQKRVARRLELDLAVPELRDLVRVDADKYVRDLLSPGALQRVAEPVPAATIAGWVFDRVQSLRLQPQTARAVEKWAGQRVVDRSLEPAEREVYARSYLVSLRWQPGGWLKVDGLREQSAWTNPLVWMRRWARSTPQHEAVSSPMKARQWADRLVDDLPVVSADEADEIGWQLALADPADPPPGAPELRFALAVRRRDDLGKALEAARPAVDWLVRLVQLIGLKFGAGVRSWETGGRTYVGVELAPGSATPEERHLVQALVRDRVLQPAFLRDGADRTLAAAPGRGAGESDDFRAAQRAYDHVGFGGLVEELVRLSTEAFGVYLKGILPKRFSSARFEFSEWGDGTLLVGATPESRVQDPDNDRLWEKVIEAARKESYRANVRLAAVIKALLKLKPVEHR